LSLVDDAGVQLNTGTSVSNAPMFVRLEIARAPFASTRLFRESVIKLVTLSLAITEKNIAKKEKFSLPFEEPRERWSVKIPEQESDNKPFAGRIDMFYGPTSHFKIEFTLFVKDGRLMEGSDLWMAATYSTKNV
jgi:hypothetical protein